MSWVRVDPTDNSSLTSLQNYNPCIRLVLMWLNRDFSGFSAQVPIIKQDLTSEKVNMYSHHLAPNLQTSVSSNSSVYSWVFVFAQALI